MIAAVIARLVLGLAYRHGFVHTRRFRDRAALRTGRR